MSEQYQFSGTTYTVVDTTDQGVALLLDRARAALAPDRVTSIERIIGMLEVANAVGHAIEQDNPPVERALLITEAIVVRDSLDYARISTFGRRVGDGDPFGFAALRAATRT